MTAVQTRFGRQTAATNVSTVLPAYYAQFIRDRPLFLELALVFDFSIYEKYGKNKDILLDRASQIATLVNSVFQPVGIHVALTGVEIWSEKDAFPLHENGEDVLRDFVHYRLHVLSRKYPNDVAVLITSLKFKKGVVGRGLQGTICSSKSSGAMATDHSHDVFTVAITIAHEIGHNFGMPHDKEGCECPKAACIMAPTVRASYAIYWSTCSLEHLQWTVGHGGGNCLLNRPSTVLNGPLCGNGFVEDGEQCDCGLPHMCDNPCCDPKTCKLLANAVCANGRCCDLSTCRLKPVATVCRSESDQCDLAEYCDGLSEHCPEDTFKHDGELCSDGHCYAGQCGSLAQRCRLLWGDSGVPAHHFCYESNSDGTISGNCGINRRNESYLKCAPQDMKCGLLHCDHNNEKPQCGSKSTTISSSMVMKHGSSEFRCQSAMVDVGDDRADPGLVPNGAFCGPGKMCVQQKCVTVASMRAKQYCQNDCSDRGVCNNLGNCHCNVGYGGIDCAQSGLGGSVNSGPASVYGVHSGVMVAVFFFIILPLVVCVFVYLYRKGLLKHLMSKRNGLLKMANLSSRSSTGRKSKSRKVSKWITQGVGQTTVLDLTKKASLPSLPSVARRLDTQSSNGDQRYILKFSSLQANAEQPPALLANTLRRSTERPKIPAPPRPPSPTRLSGERVYCEIHPVGLASDDLTNALSSLPYPDAVMPQRRAPPPPTEASDRKTATMQAYSSSSASSSSIRSNSTLGGSVGRRPQQAPPLPPPKPLPKSVVAANSGSSTTDDATGGVNVKQLAAKFVNNK